MSGSIVEIFDKMEFKIYEYYNEILNSMMILKNYYSNGNFRCRICFNKYSETHYFSTCCDLVFHLETCHNELDAYQIIDELESIQKILLKIKK